MLLRNIIWCYVLTDWRVSGFVEFESSFIFRHMISTPSVLRNLRITAYMAHSCPIPTVKSFADATPFAVLFHDVAVLVHTNEPFPPNHIFAVLNCTFIALCVRNSVDQSKVVGFFFFFLVTVPFHLLSWMS